LTLAEGEVLATKAHKRLFDHNQPVLCPYFTKKLHRLSVHLLEEFRYQGSLYDGSTAYNETLLKAVKME